MQHPIQKDANDALDKLSADPVARDRADIRELELKIHQYSVALLRAQARAEPLAEGRLQGKQIMLLRQLSRKFGDPPAVVHTRIARATEVDVNLWADRVLFAETLEAVFSSGA
jgi:hypothetical protein